ncbi:MULTISPECIES: lipid IV(A) 4-amino-4-deoxy-L-arabinosyltransferase [unclassified Pseudomonas]|uniref:lipid IV(A) 4-amino-4-deoxy-L-arabinosyltransferase n=1 Tax=unclassified Pseudomonas TaxID=196821 RepID=UPI000D385492|nr:MULTISPECIES: lipid IV(A) 4-amino-4-deoxy-L-arabinosyltransferase [unclassified Pseudomonas]RAU48136.1 lipid IV(A) 4-amino-4-deoxy-L-arabinosyltransferase [Pseudomonas sp. RIT 409]RAU55166.1 lipid IV(A) 4-amino-4-deoxy-L-arabinosyltransferase [Pseudomonas sp. RIT 412]
MTRAQSIGILAVAFGLAYLLPLGFHGLWIPDETRYAQVAQEMLHSGNWAAPHFMGLRYFEKPAAGYWLIAVSQAIFGENLFGVRFASALTTGLTGVLVYLLASQLWEDAQKRFACALLFLSFMFVAGQAGYANLDPQFTLWVSLSLAAFWLAVHRTGNIRLLYWALLGVACALGFMTKGFLALAMPVLVALPYMLWQRRLRELFTFGPVAVLVATLISLPWALTVQVREPDFWHFFFWHEHIRRFAGEDAQHAQPWWFYLPLLVAACLPWAVLLPATLRQAWHQRRLEATGFLLLWLWVPLIFLSAAKGKLPTYILPCLVPLALLMGSALVDRLRTGAMASVRCNGLFNAALGGLALAALGFTQIKKPLYFHEPQHLTLAVTLLLLWVACNVMQALRPMRFWALPALGGGLLVALLPMALPHDVVFNKTPDRFIARYQQPLAATRHLLSNDLGVAAALSWRLQRQDVVFYDTRGELEYGLSYPQATPREVDWTQVQAWMRQARREGSVGVVMRGDGPDQQHALSLLPTDGQQYREGNLLILIFDRMPS